MPNSWFALHGLAPPQFTVYAQFFPLIHDLGAFFRPLLTPASTAPSLSASQFTVCTSRFTRLRFFGAFSLLVVAFLQFFVVVRISLMSVTFSGRNSRNGCADFMGAWDFWLLSGEETSMPITFLVLGGGYFGFCGGEVQFYFSGPEKGVITKGVLSLEKSLESLKSLIL